MEMVFLLRFNYFALKNYQEFEFFIVSKVTSKSDFFAIFYQRQRKINSWSLNRSYWITPRTEILPIYEQQLQRSSFQKSFSSSAENCVLVSGSHHLIEAGLYFKRHTPKKKRKIAKFQQKPCPVVLLNR